MGGFSNPLIGAGGTLVYPSIHSPNYVHDLSGWTINKDGSAEFDDLTLRGSFVGDDWIINATGEFFYSGTPATGNLIFSNVAGSSGTDDFGNHYLGNGSTWYGLVAGVAMTAIAGGLEFFTGSLSGGWSTLEAQLFYDSTHDQLTFEGPVAFGGVNGTTVRITNNLAGSPISSHAIAEIDGNLLADALVAIVSGAAETYHTISTGFPSGYSGAVSYKLLGTGDLTNGATEVMLVWKIKVASTTVVSDGASLATLPSGYFYTGDNTIIGGSVSGGGLTGTQYASLTLTSGGVLKYEGPAFTASGQAFIYGQAVISTVA